MWWGVQVAVYAILVLGYAALPIVAVRRRIERGRTQRFLEAMLLVALVRTTALGLIAFWGASSWWAYVGQRLTQVSLVVLAFLSAEFAAAFVWQPVRLKLRLGGLALLLAAALAIEALSARLSAVLVTWLPSGPAPAGLVAGLLVAGWLVFTALAWWLSFQALRRATNAEHRNRIHYLLLALLWLTVGDLLLLGTGLAGVYVGLAVRLVGLGVATFALVRTELPDVKRWLWTGLRFVLLTAITVAGYLVVLVAVGSLSGFVPDLPSLLAHLPAVLLALVIAGAAGVLLGPALRRRFDRLLLGESYDIQAALRTYSQQINLILDLERLADTTLGWLQTTLGVERSAFILLTAQTDGRIELKVLRAVGASLPSPQPFAADGRFLLHFRNVRRPLGQYELDMLSWFRAMPVEERTWLAGLALDLYVPILVAGQPLALLGLGSKAGGRSYSQRDVEILMTLAAQTGTALENARLLDDLRALQEDLRRLSDELAETNRQLQRLDQTKADFVAIASHELRTPLTQIFGYSDVLASLSGDELSDVQQWRSFVEGISSGAGRLKRVVDAMIDVSLIETGGLVLQLEPLPVGMCVRQAVEAVRPALQQRSLDLTVQDLSSLPDIKADYDRLTQVFVGLLSNAIKYSPDGSEIDVSGRLAEVSGQDLAVEILVADSGIGIDLEQQDLIFEKFYRAESALFHSSHQVRFKGGGPGLGLAIAKGIVAAHGGEIWVESPGRDEKLCPGSTFYVRLPVAGSVREVDDV